MATLGSESEPGGSTQAYGLNVTNQFASALTLPAGGPWKITALGCWFAGWNESMRYKLCVWDSSMNLLRQSSGGTVALKTMTLGNATKVEQGIADTVVDGGDTVWVGFHSHSDDGRWFPHTGSGTRRQKTTGDSPTSMSGYSAATGNLGVWLTYSASNQPPTAPTPQGPADGARVLTTQPNLNWKHNDPDGDPQDKRYVEIDNGSGFGSAFVYQSTSPDTQWDVSAAAGLNRGNTYYWHVRTADAANGYGPYSATRSFKINALPTATHVSPPNNGLAVIHNLGTDLAVWTAGGAHAKPKLDWTFNDSDGDSQAAYEVEIWSALTLGTRLYTSGLVNSDVTNHLAEWAGINGTQYFWTVRVKDSVGEWGPWTTRTAFKMRWSQAIYDFPVPGGATSSAWQFASTGVLNIVNFLFATATGPAGAGRSAWKSNVSTLVPAAYLNVMVRLSTKTVGSPGAVGTMTFSFIAAAQQPDRWVTSHVADWSLDPGVRRYGAKSLHAAIKTASGDRYIYPYAKTAGDDVSVSPNTEYTLSAYISTGLLPVHADISLRVFATGGLTNELTDLYLDDLTLPIDVPVEPGGPTRNDRTRNTALLDPVSGLPQYPEGWRRLTLRFRTAEQDRIRPVIYYGGAGAGTITIDDTFWVDAVQMEESRMAMPWAPGLVGEPSVTDMQGLVVDAQAGGILRLRDVAATRQIDLERLMDAVLPSYVRMERATSNQTVAGSSVTGVIYNSVIASYDPVDDFTGDTGAGTVTINRAGMYLLMAGVEFAANVTGRREMYLRSGPSINVAAQGHDAYATGTIANAMSCSGLVYLGVGAVVQVVVRHTVGAGLAVNADRNTFLCVMRLPSL